MAGTEEIKFWIMSWGSNALVLEPISLKDEIQGEAKRLVAFYKGDVEGEVIAHEGMS